MEREFQKAFKALNTEQKAAVTRIDGPLLVIAGPGTGKTQLLSTRVGYILSNTDTPPESLLCLTFTEAGAAAMRERLTSLLGAAAYDVSLSTYHAFGGEILRRYPEFFEDAELELVDELAADVLLRSIIARLPYSSPLKFADSYLGDIKTFISDAKRALLAPSDIKKIAAANLKFVSAANEAAQAALAELNTVLSKKDLPTFEKLLKILAKLPAPKLPDSVVPLAACAGGELATALEDCAASGKTTALSRWKRAWLAKDVDGNYIFEGQRAGERLAAAAKVYAAYQESLKAEHLYDYDDMILRVINALEANPDFKYTVAEQYSYIMLDEFQDTNPAQARLVELLSDHPVHEGRPNVMAVGDDDQAIYAFQGATHANMAAFARHYRDVKVISLKQNYRSHQELLEAGAGIAGQISDRLHQKFPGVGKTLVAANKDLPEPPAIELREFISDAAQHQWIASEINRLIKGGMPASEIAVLAPKHKYLEALLPYLSSRQLPVRYERRENILEDPLVRQLEQMSRLVTALAEGNEALADALWPEVLSYDFWRLPVESIWKTGWLARAARQPWTAALLNDSKLRRQAEFFLRLASLLPLTTLEQQLDALIGLPETSQELKLPLTSPLFEYYFGGRAARTNAPEYVRLIASLNVLRDRLRGWRQRRGGPTSLADFVEFIDGYRAANINILNTSPYHESADAINLLTAYGAKGREFRAVFVLSAVDEAWGTRSRSQGYRLSLPANLSFIRYQGASEDERLRLLYVAATRARTRLYLTGFKQTLAGKTMNRLKYLDIAEAEDDNPTSRVLPAKFAQVLEDKQEGLSLEAAQNYWTDRHRPPFRLGLRAVLAPQLERYALSATHLNHFLDVEEGGPQSYFLQCILGFAGAPSLRAAYGTAIHSTLRLAGTVLTRDSRLPSQRRLLEVFGSQLEKYDLPAQEQKTLAERGRLSLSKWLAERGQDLSASDKYEYDFASEGVTLGPVRLSGKVDRLIINQKERAITVLDYKTGQSYQRWQGGVVKLHKFRQQLMMYKLLVEGSNRFKGYRVTGGIIEFVEPDEQGRINQLALPLDTAELDDFKLLLAAVWRRVQRLDLPDISGYPKTLTGIKAFEADLIKEQRALVKERLAKDNSRSAKTATK